MRDRRVARRILGFMLIEELPSQQWRWRGFPARVNFLQVHWVRDILVAPTPQHGCGDTRYATFVEKYYGEDGVALASRAETFHLVCGPPNPPYRASRHFSKSLRPIQHELVRMAAAPRLTGKLELVHPFILVRYIYLKDRPRKQFPWVRLEQKSITTGMYRWVDIVSIYDMDSYRELVYRHYRNFYERWRASPFPLRA